jgi:quercetin dioxygenase-like cupin family protein
MSGSTTQGRFITQDEIVRETFDWGQSGWIARPSLTGSTALCIMDVTIKPGGGHNFHRHPDQEEVIWVREGRIEQWLEREKHELGPGEAVYIPRDMVHASFTVGDTPAKLSVILSPTAGDDGYSVIDVFEEEPWSSLRN